MFPMLISLHSFAYWDSGARDCHLVLWHPCKATFSLKGKHSKVVLQFFLRSFLSLFSLILRVTREKELRTVLQYQWPMLATEYTQRLEQDYLICKSMCVYVCVCACVCVCSHVCADAWGCQRCWIPWSWRNRQCELPSIGAKNWTHILWKDSTLS